MTTVSGVWEFNTEVKAPTFSANSYGYYAFETPPTSVTVIKTDGTSVELTDFLYKSPIQIKARINDNTTQTWIYVNSWIDDYYRYWDFGSDQEVSDDYYAWLTANATQYIEENQSEIVYDGVSTYIESEQSATLECNGKKMKSDIVVTFGSNGTIIYNGTHTSIDNGKSATLQCKGMIMKSNVEVHNKVNATTETKTATVTLTWGTYIENAVDSGIAVIAGETYTVDYNWSSSTAMPAAQGPAVICTNPPSGEDSVQLGSGTAGVPEYSESGTVEFTPTISGNIYVYGAYVSGDVTISVTGKF